MSLAQLTDTITLKNSFSYSAGIFSFSFITRLIKTQSFYSIGCLLVVLLAVLLFILYVLVVLVVLFMAICGVVGV